MMSKCRWCWLVLMASMLLPVRLLGSEGAVVLENDSIRLEVSSQTGAVTRIFDKHTNTEYITPGSQTRLFQFVLPEPGNLGRQINSEDQKPISVQVADGVLTIKFDNLQILQKKYLFQAGEMESPQPKLPIATAITFRLQGEHILASIKIENRSLEQITDVVFPRLDDLPTTSGGHPFEVVLPSLSDKKLKGGPEFLVGERTKTYPALLATSWLNYQAVDKSIGIEIQSPPETQEGLVSLAANGLVAANRPRGGIRYIGWDFYPHIDGRTTWKSPPIIIHVHGADWHMIAAEHREWYRAQHTPKTVTAFDDAIGFATYRLKSDNNTINWRYSDLPKLADISATAGMHDLVIDGWREREGPGNPCPFGEVPDARLGGAAGLKAVNETLEKSHVNLLFAFHPAYINTAADHYKTRNIRWTVKTRREVEQMQPQFTFYTFDYPYEEEIAHFWGVTDPSLPVTDELLHDAQRLRDEYGFRNLFLRGVGLQSYLSYNKEDIVPPQRVFEVGYKHFLGGLHTLFPNGMLLMEGFNDLVNPYGVGGYTWVQNQDAEVLAYSIPWVPFSNDVDALDYDQANESFARKVLINLIVDGGDGTVKRYVEFAKHLKALQSLKQATSPYYAQAEFRDHDGLKKIEADDQVVASVFDNPSHKKRGIVLANLSDQEKKIAVELDSQVSGAKGRLYRLGGQQSEIDLPKISVQLAPYEIVVVGIDEP